MKTLDLQACRRMDDAALRAKAQEHKQELFSARFGLKTGQLGDPSKLRKARRSYARIQTLISERRLSTSAGAV